MASGLELVTKAALFAAVRHAGQRRKGAAGAPYVNHLCEVADLVARATGGDDAPLVAAALLHDTLEDTETTAAEIEERFGGDVAGLVLEVTDDKTLPKARRKRRQVESAGGKTPRAKLIKLADKISNVREVGVAPPDGWEPQRRRDYVAWAREVVTALGPVDADLESLFEETARATDAAIGG